MTCHLPVLHIAGKTAYIINKNVIIITGPPTYSAGARQVTVIGVRRL